MTAIEMPFALLFVGTIGILGGWLAVIPLAAALHASPPLTPAHAVTPHAAGLLRLPCPRTPAHPTLLHALHTNPERYTWGRSASTTTPHLEIQVLARVPDVVVARYADAGGAGQPIVPVPQQRRVQADTALRANHLPGPVKAADLPTCRASSTAVQQRYTDALRPGRASCAGVRGMGT